MVGCEPIPFLTRFLFLFFAIRPVGFVEYHGDSILCTWRYWKDGGTIAKGLNLEMVRKLHDGSDKIEII